MAAHARCDSAHTITFTDNKAGVRGPHIYQNIEVNNDDDDDDDNNNNNNNNKKKKDFGN